MKIKTLVQALIFFYLIMITLVFIGIYNLNAVNKEISDIRESRFKLLAKYDRVKCSDQDSQFLLESKQELKNLNKELDNNFKYIFMIMLLASLSFIFTYKEIRRKVLVPIKKMNRIITLYQNGSQDVEAIAYNDDEIGLMIKEFFIMKKKLDDEYTTLEKLALTDPLTGILNRRAFFEISEKIFNIAKRKKTCFAILIIDVDFFKKVNDVHGHLIGDEILKFLVENIKATIRESDILARFGGEEFIVLLPDTNEEGADTLAQKIRASIEKTSYIGKSLTVPISVSIGVAKFKDEKFLSEVIRRADEGLYKAKELGRNRVEIA